MGSSKGVILGDMSAIRDCGLEFFQDNYFWPVSDDEFNTFSKNLHDIYVQLILDIDNNDLFNIALIELSFVEKLVQILHFNYIKEYSTKYGIELLSGEDSKSFREPDWSQIGDFYSNPSFPFGRVTRLIRRVIKNIIFNKHLSILNLFKGFFVKNSAQSIGSMDVFKMEFIKQKKIYVDHIDWIDLIKNSNNNKQSISIQSKFLEDTVVNKFFQAIENDNSLFLHNVNVNEIKIAWNKRFSDILNLFPSITVGAKTNMLLVTDMAKPHTKLITIAYQSLGTDVYCFHHGNDACYSDQSIAHKSTISHSKFFVTPTNGIKDNYENFYSKLDIEKRCGTNYFSINSSFYSDLYAKYSSRDKSEVNKIMIMGFPFDPSRYDIENNLFFYKILSLEHRLIKTLKDAGYYVLYKAHPDRLNEVKGLFDGLVDEYLSKPFELVWQRSDLVLFTYTSSTAFGFALTTNLPIILVDSAKDSRCSIELKDMHGRVNIVDALVDKKMMIQFNKKHLLKMIKNTNYNFLYVDRILGHKNVVKNAV